jgi:hypothetical protein
MLTLQRTVQLGRIQSYLLKCLRNFNLDAYFTVLIMNQGNVDEGWLGRLGVDGTGLGCLEREGV